MKHILLAHLLIGLLLIALFSVLSYGYLPSYVYIYWRDIQIQTNVWMLLFLLMLISLSIQMLWLGVKRYLNRAQRQKESVFNFKQLHPYEQLAVIWLLNAAYDQQQFIRGAFQNSTLLKHVIDARLYTLSEDYNQAKNELKNSNSMAFELAELQRIEVYLAEGNSELALTHLEFLTQHELSPWLNDVRSAYEQRLQILWGEFAIQFPWLYLRSTQYGHLDSETKSKWLSKLLKVFDQADFDDLNRLQKRYLDLESEIFQRSESVKILWLKVLARLPDLAIQHENLALELLENSFQQEVFYLWFQQQMLAQQPDYQKIEAQISKWDTKYASIPVLTFAKWHVFSATGREAEAAQLLELYPHDALMSYLRIKSVLVGREELIPELNTVFQNNANFIAIKI
jgi:hypothetical protein